MSPCASTTEALAKCFVAWAVCCKTVRVDPKRQEDGEEHEESEVGVSIVTTLPDMLLIPAVPSIHDEYAKGARGTSCGFTEGR